MMDASAPFAIGWKDAVRSAAKLIEAANPVCGRDERQPELVVLRGVFHKRPAKLPQGISRKALKFG
jgi:hypothetical protein